MSVVDQADTWQLGFRTLEEEFLTEVELPVSGDIPADLQGRLYRVSPARFDVYGDRVRHWFDADGMVHALRIDTGRVFYRNRFVATRKKLSEDKAQRRLYGVVGTRPAGGPLRRALRAMPPRSPANTNIVFHAGRLLALWEGARPYRIDPDTLETIGEESFDGLLGRFDAFSAHPHYDPATGQLWGFGPSYGPRPMVNLYCGDPDGTMSRKHRVSLPSGAWMHDFAVSASKVVLVVPPLTSPRFPLGLYSGTTSYADGLKWKPQLGTRIAVVDRASGETRWHETEPFMMVHTINAFDDGDDVILDVCTFEDASIMDTVRDALTGTLTGAGTPPFAERLTLSRSGKVERARLSPWPLEFPRLAGGVATTASDRIYGCTFLGGAFDNIPAAIDTATGSVSAAPMAPGEIGGEPIPVSKRGRANETDVWLLVVVLNGNNGRSELRIYDGGDPAGGPVATAELPHVVPLHFHGTFVREHELHARPDSERRVS